MGSISLRKYIRWLPDEASEPTSTLVLTSPQRRFVDLRIFKAGDAAALSDTPDGTLPLSRLEWGMAGTINSFIRDDGQGGQVSHSQFHHWIDSLSKNPAMDEGDMFPQADGTTLEKGSMVNPATGVDTPYEELWLDKDPAPGYRCVVLEMEGNGGTSRGMVVRLGPYCQGFMRVGDELAGERWEMEGGVWRRTARMGEGVLPCSAVLETGFGVGDTVMEAWKVVEALG